MSALEPRIERREGFLVVGLKVTGTPHTMDCGALWGEFAPRTDEIPDALGDGYYGICCAFRGDGTFDYVAAVRVGSADVIPAGMTVVQVPPGTYAIFGAQSLDEIGETWRAIYEQWLPSSGRKCTGAPCFELYPPDYDPAAGRPSLELYQPVTEVISR